MALTQEFIIKELRHIQDPERSKDIVILGMVREVEIDGGEVFVHLQSPSKNPEIKETIKARVEEHLLKCEGVEKANVQISQATAAAGQASDPFSEKKPGIPGIKHIITVGSGKGGVGKSTVSVNLAISLAKKGFKVGIMDGDIYGPNLPLMLGIPHDHRPEVSPEQKMIPLEAHGIKVISMGFLIPKDQPMVWRGPMLHSAVQQFLTKVEWGELDYLVIDLPPGTGDVQLSLVQSTTVSGAVLVSTPQEVALEDVRKAVLMFKKMNVEILGIIENMSGDIFGKGGAEKAAQDFKIPFLGSIPLDSSVRLGGDGGKPLASAQPDHDIASEFSSMSDKISNAVPSNC